MKKHHLAGAMVWDISQDDFSDMCGSGKFPLSRTVAEQLDTIVDTMPRTSSLINVCYYPSKASQRRAPYTYLPEFVPARYCTHIIWTFLTVVNKLPRLATAEVKGGYLISLSLGP